MYLCKRAECECFLMRGRQWSREEGGWWGRKCPSLRVARSGVFTCYEAGEGVRRCGKPLTGSLPHGQNPYICAYECLSTTSPSLPPPPPSSCFIFIYIYIYPQMLIRYDSSLPVLLNNGEKRVYSVHFFLCSVGVHGTPAAVVSHISLGEGASCFYMASATVLVAPLLF